MAGYSKINIKEVSNVISKLEADDFSKTCKENETDFFFFLSV